jgi:hypothetical protein
MSKCNQANHVCIAKWHRRISMISMFGHKCMKIADAGAVAAARQQPR